MQQRHRPRRTPLVARLFRWGPNRVRTQLVKLEHEISSLAPHWNGHPAGRSSHAKKRRRRPGMIDDAVRRLSSLGNACKSWGRSVAVSLRNTVNATIRSAPVRPFPQKAAPDAHRRLSPKQSARKSVTLTGVLLAACFGLVSVCSILFVALFLQIREMKSEIALWKTELATTKMQLARSEKLAQEAATSNNQSPASTYSSGPFQPSLYLSEDERKNIRQFIKVLPPKPGAKRTIELGAEIPSSAAAYVPQELIDELPKLRGARYSIDQNGSIIMMSDGSSRADVIIEYQQPR